MNTPVNFEIAKLLKEKGFDRPCCEFYYMENNPNKLEESFNKSKKWDFNFENEYYFPCKSISAPTIAEVVMWLYEKHGIWISIAPKFNNDGSLWFVYESLILSINNMTTLNDNLFKGHFNEMFKTPVEAYSAAILYALNILIMKITNIDMKFTLKVKYLFTIPITFTHK